MRRRAPVLWLLCCALAGCGDDPTTAPILIQPPDLTVRAFGAIPNDDTDDTAALQAAIDSAQTLHTLLRFEAGSYKVRRNLYVSAGPLMLRGNGRGTVLEADQTSTAFDTVLGLLTVGYDVNQHVSEVHDLIVEDLSIDGHFMLSSLYCTRSDRCTFRRVTAANSSRGVCRVFLSTDITFDDCSVSGGRGISGDGILFGGVIRPTVVNTDVSDFTRIGICTEADDPVRSEDAVIMRNTVHHAHDATSPEHNAAIWLENTNGGIVSNNIAWDLDNAPQTSSRGITLGTGTTRDCWFTLRDNVITRAAIGVVIGCGPKGNVIVDGLELEVGDRPFDYSVGVQVSSAGSVFISNAHFGDVVWSGSGSGTILIDLEFGLTTLSIRDCHIGSRSYGSSADVHLYALNGNALENMVLTNLHGWRVQFNECPTQLFVSNCELSPFDLGCPITPGIQPTRSVYIGPEHSGALRGDRQ
jgi:parallel beta helix pectate lyase-like protein